MLARARELFLALSISLASFAGAARAQSSQATDIDGETIVGNWNTMLGDTRAFVWTPAAGMVDIGTLGGDSSQAVAVSGGNVVGLSSTASGESHGFLWRAAGGMQDLGPIQVRDVDGDNVVGTFFDAAGERRAFLWTPAEGVLDLGALVTPDPSIDAVAVSGGTVVGRSGNSGFVWTLADGMRQITFGGPGSACAVSGGNVVGAQYAVAPPQGTQHAFLWNAAAGTRDLGTLNPPFGFSFATTVSGGNVVGYSETPLVYNPCPAYCTDINLTHAFFWNEAVGMVDLSTLAGDRSDQNFSSMAVGVSGDHVAGESTTSSLQRHAFYWSAAEGMVDLGTLGGPESNAVAISGANVAGTADTGRFDPPDCSPPPCRECPPACGPARRNRHAFLWNAATGMIDLGTLAGTVVPLYLRAQGSNLILDPNFPTAVTAAYRDSGVLKLAGGNPWKVIGIWQQPATGSTRTLADIGDLRVWLGLKNSDEQGARFDLSAEVLKNGVKIATGEIHCLTGVTRSPSPALEVMVPIGGAGTVTLGPTDVLSVKVSARMGSNGQGASCGGHANAGLRLYFDTQTQAAQVEVEVR